MMRLLLACLAVLLGCGQIVAQEIILGRAGASNVFVWTDREAQKRVFNTLLRDGGATEKNVAYILSQTACVVPVGTRARIIETVSASYAVEVIGHACSGIVQKEDTN